MGNELYDGEDLFARLVTGNIPDDPDGISPMIYKAALVDAIKVHENEMRSAGSGMREAEMFLEFVQDMIDDGEAEEGDRALLKSLTDLVESHRGRMATAQDLMKSCESRLLDLLEKHPELNE